MSKYSFHFHWSDEDGGYIATCPEFPGLSAFGETFEEAASEAQVALEGMIESYRITKKTLPEPEPVQKYSGQFRTRISRSLHKKAVVAAAKEGVSLNAYVQEAIAEKVGGDLKKQEAETKPAIIILQGSSSTPSRLHDLTSLDLKRPSTSTGSSLRPIKDN